MSDEEDKKLEEESRLVVNAAREALRWLEETSNESARSNAGLEKTQRKAVVQATKLQAAADRKMTVGVFGASQAGKSYLISALARKGENRLLARYGEDLVDFIAEINPEGGKEATGVVTRFTVERPEGLPEGHPIQLGLLTEIDVVRILANSFVHDLMHPEEDDSGDPTEPHVAIIAATLASLEARTGASPVTIEDSYELEDYVTKRLGPLKNTRISALKRAGYWHAAESLLPQMGVEDRVKFYSILWEDLEVYSNICSRLLAALEALGNPREAYCAPDALFINSGGQWQRHPMSIVNVATLSGIGDTSDDKVSVTSLSGRTVEIERAELTALISEMIIVIDEQPFDFFAHTDLLDFPGARSRTQISQDPRVLGAMENRTENFLRGKVAYLFERYCDEQELTSMLLAVGPSNMEVTSLPGMVQDWIASTHGMSPDERAKHENALFFILSKFDMEFERGAGKSLDESRWTTRMEASLIKAFGGARSAASNWVDNWADGIPFNNCFWIRNPNIRSDALFAYEGDSQVFKETGVLNEDTKEFFDSLFTGYMESEAIQRHFREPKMAWDAGLSLNDGGVTRLAESLAPVCQPGLKRDQVRSRLERLASAIHTNLSAYFISGDINQVREEKKLLAVSMVRALAGCLQSQKLGEFLAALRMDESAAVDVFLQTEREAASVIATGASTQPAAQKAADDVMSALGLDEEPNGTDGEDESDGPKDFPDLFVSNLEGAWSEGLHTVAENEAYMSYFGCKGEDLKQLTNELSIIARRLGVFDQMADMVRSQYQFKLANHEAWRWKQISPACDIFNKFISFLGCMDEATADGVEVENLKGEPMRIFRPLEPIVGEFELDDAVGSKGKQYFTDWLMALQFQTKGNAEFQVGFMGDAKDNEVLGRILDELAPLSAE
jgi:hypothetical protein